MACCHNQCGARSGSPQLNKLNYVIFSCHAQTHAETDNSVTISVSPSSTQETRTYSVKIMNQGKKSEYTIRKFTLNYQFTKVSEMKQSLSIALKFDIDTFGYIEPGHGLKGRQQWLVQDEDLEQMYRSYKKRGEILLWCIRPHNGADTERKRGRGESTDESRPVKRTCSQKIKDVEDLLTQLREKHGQKYTTEQLSCWAHMYHMEKHKSLDFPPNLPFFSGRKRDTSAMGPSSQSTSSPHRRVGMRSESIRQLVDWHSLLEKGGISKEQYDEVQQAILKDMKDNML